MNPLIPAPSSIGTPSSEKSGDNATSAVIYSNFKEGDLYDKPQPVRSVEQPNSEATDHPGVSDLKAIRTFLESVGLPTDLHYAVHFQAFVQAQRIYADRYPKYRDEPIHEMGAKGVLVQARTCVSRIWAKHGPGNNTRLRAGKLYSMDDTYDAINYLAHFITQMFIANNGDWKWDDK